MHGLTLLGFLGAASITTIATSDAVSYALTGDNLVADVDGPTPLGNLVKVVHAGAYLVLAAVLHRHRIGVDARSRLRRVVRTVVTGALVLTALAMGLGAVAGVATGSYPAGAAYATATGLGFGLMLLGSAVLGLMLLRRPGFTWAAWTLAGVLGAFLLLVVLGAAGSPWAHPVYPEVCSAFGLALVGLTPRDDSEHRDLPHEGRVRAGRSNRLLGSGRS